MSMSVVIKNGAICEYHNMIQRSMYGSDMVDVATDGTFIAALHRNGQVYEYNAGSNGNIIRIYSVDSSSVRVQVSNGKTVVITSKGQQMEYTNGNLTAIWS